MLIPIWLRDSLCGRAVWRASGGAVLLVAGLAACAPPPPAPPPPASSQPMPEQQARFDARPEAIFSALEQACTAPHQRLQRPAPDVLECRMLLPPAPTAHAILRYSGTIERLPELVIRLRLQDEPGGFVLGAAQFLEVPQATGGDLRVVYPDRVLDARLREVLVSLGGDVTP